MVEGEAVAAVLALLAGVARAAVGCWRASGTLFSRRSPGRKGE